MADYDPRTDTGIPTEPVGTLPRPGRLQAAYAGHAQGKISPEDLEREKDAAVKEVIEREEASGQPINCDGGFRWSSFATYPIADTLAGTGLAPTVGPGGQYFAIFADGTGRRLPMLTGGPLKYNYYAADSLIRSLPYATKPLKQAVMSPSMLVPLYPANDPIEGYSREEFEEDIVKECVTDVRKALEAGAVRVSIDFTEGWRAIRGDPRNPWTIERLLPHFIALNNRVLANFSDDERRNIGIHTSPGGDRDSVHVGGTPPDEDDAPASPEDPPDLPPIPPPRYVPVEDRFSEIVLPELFKINAGYFLIPLGPRHKWDRIFEIIGGHSREDQLCYLGLTSTESARIETPSEICDAVVRAASFIPSQRLATTDDYTFSPLSFVDPEATRNPDYALDMALTKIANRVEGTRRAAEMLGVS